jgi:hypothetical protein
MRVSAGPVPCWLHTSFHEEKRLNQRFSKSEAQLDASAGDAADGLRLSNSAPATPPSALANSDGAVAITHAMDK